MGKSNFYKFSVSVISIFCLSLLVIFTLRLVTADTESHTCYSDWGFADNLCYGDEFEDDDGDGYTEAADGFDCNDGNADIYPGATDDTLDGVDQNCNGLDGEDGSQSLDSDSDGLSDAEEAELGTDPFYYDTDGDGLNDYDEINVHETDPLNTDSDNDGLSDSEEVNIYDTDPNDDDSDNDSLSDYDEVFIYGTNPQMLDTDGDSYNDGDEVDIYGTDPNDGSDFPSAETNDADNDGILDENDNCPSVTNPNQANLDGDSKGDACDNDIDGDGYPVGNGLDNDDYDSTVYPGALENCSDGKDNDQDGYTDGDDFDCQDMDDLDGDGISDESDNCPGISNNDQSNIDGDEYGDVCDLDRDGDGIDDADDYCKTTPSNEITFIDEYGCAPSQRDYDNDNIFEDVDNCPSTYNPDQSDSDNDGKGDICDEDELSFTELNNNEVYTIWATQAYELNFYIEVPSGAEYLNVSISGGTGDADLYVNYETRPDGTASNPADWDCSFREAGNEEACSYLDPVAGTYYITVYGYTNYNDVKLLASYSIDETQADDDGDGVINGEDQCPGQNDKIDTDSDGIPDCIDTLIDNDGDGVSDDQDTCPGFDDTKDKDKDGLADDCDEDDDGDGVKDIYDECPDTIPGKNVDNTGCEDGQIVLDSDTDGVVDSLDLCPDTSSGQVDANGCADYQKDTDGDGVTDNIDQCIATPAGQAVDSVGCAVNENPTVNVSAPTNLKATGTIEKVFLEWELVAGHSYNIYRSEAANVQISNLNLIKANQVTGEYTDNSVRGSRTYYYVVTAVKSGTESTASNEVSAYVTYSVSKGDGVGANYNLMAEIEAHYTAIYQANLNPNTIEQARIARNASNSPLIYNPNRNIEFADVPSSHWAYKYIDVIKNYHNKLDQYVISGIGNKDKVPVNRTALFAPDRYMSRLGVAKMAIILSGNEINPDNIARSQIYFDVPQSPDEDSSWTRAIMYTAYQLGYIDRSDGYARPNEYATRAEALTILTRAADIYDGGTYPVSKFTDIKANAWYKNIIGFMEDKIDMKEITNSKFYPDSYIKRAEVVKFAYEITKLVSWIQAEPSLINPLMQ